MQLRDGKSTLGGGKLPSSKKAGRRGYLKTVVAPSRSDISSGSLKRSSSSTDSLDSKKPKKLPDRVRCGRKIDLPSLKKKLTTKLQIEDAVVDVILSTILKMVTRVTFDDVVGQEEAVKQLRERVVYPALNPDLFKGQKVLRPPRGVLLYGPTGNGKTLLAKACANQAHYNFMNVSASALISKWVGDSEKLVRLLFECAREIQPTIVFIDEIDAMLSQRGGSEREDTRRFKNEFLVHFDGMLCSSDDHILILGATNLPQTIDAAALRRFDLRVYLGPPTQEAREKLLDNILKNVSHNLGRSDKKMIVSLTKGYSASDLETISRNAAWISLGSIEADKILTLRRDEVPSVTIDHYLRVINSYVPSNAPEDVEVLEAWSQLHK